MMPNCVRRGTGDRRRLGRTGWRRVVGQRFRQPEVEHLDGAVRPDLDVGGLQIAMDDPLLVRRFERVGDLPGDRQRFVERERAACDPVGERRPLDQLEDQRVDAVRLFEAVDRSRCWDG